MNYKNHIFQALVFSLLMVEGNFLLTQFLVPSWHPQPSQIRRC